MARRVFGAVWHIVTAVFLVSAVTLFLVAFGVVESRELLRFIAIAFAASFGVGLIYLVARLDAILKPFPALVVASLVGVSVLAWVASSRSP